MKALFIFILCIALSLQIFSQDLKRNYINYTWEMDSINYIRNPSFEEFVECPVYIGMLSNAKHWRVPPGAVLHTPGYFHRCSNDYETSYDSKAGVPVNAFGHQEPRTGDGYIGFGTFSRYKYVENVQTQLKEPLNEGETYRIGMFVSLSEYSKYAHDRFTFCLTFESELKIRRKRYKGTSNQHLVCPNCIIYKSQTLLTDTLNWINIEVEYVAKGGERFLTLGSFIGDVTWWERQIKIRNIFNRKWMDEVPVAHYYVDDVYVISLEDYLNMMQNNEKE